MEEKQSKADVIKENIESTIENAIDTQSQLLQTDDYKERQKLLDKNEGRAQAIPTFIRDMKKAEAAEEIALDQERANRQ